jgi:hypothetical protein
MHKIIRITIITFFLTGALPLNSAEFASSIRIGFAPETGGSMHSGWQLEELEVEQGIYDINRSRDGIPLSTIEAPLGFTAAFDLRLILDKLYFKAGAGYNRVIAGGKGTTLDDSATDVVKVKYKQWSVDFPLTAGVTLLFWGESRISLGGGFAFAYGNYSNSFKSDIPALNHSAAFTSYALPIVAELSGEVFISSGTSLICSINHYYGRSKIVNDGSDYARVDFSGTRFTAGVVKYFNR